MAGVKPPKTSSYVPVSALGVDSKIWDIKLKSSWWWMVGGGSQRLLCLNPTTVMVVLLLGLWLLLGCDNILPILTNPYHNNTDFSKNID